MKDWNLDIYGCHNPSVLRNPHEFVAPTSEAFRGVLARFSAKGGVLGSHPPSILEAGPDYGISLPAISALKEWGDEANQNYLVDRVPDMKYASCHTLICDSNLSDSVLGEIMRSRLGHWLTGGSIEELDWFDSVDKLLPLCGWFYIPLPEYVEYNLLIYKTAEPTGSRRETFRAPGETPPSR